MKTKQSFGDVLRLALKKTLFTQDDAARIVGMVTNTFRTHLKRNDFAEYEIRLLLTKLNLKPDRRTMELGPRWGEVGLTNLPELSLVETVHEADKKRRATDQHLDRFARELIPIVRAMGENDFAINTSSTVTPLEFEREVSPELFHAVTVAVKNHATFVYLRPTPGFLKTFIGTWRFDRIPDGEAIALEQAWFHERLKKALVRDHHVGEEEAQKLVDDHIVQVLVDHSPFWAAGFSIGMVYSSKEETPVRRMFVRVPGLHKRALLQPADYDVFAARFTTFAIYSLRNAPDKDNPSLNRERLRQIINELEKSGTYE